MKIAVLGAGISGIAFAGVLGRFGHAVVVFEKSDRIGGIWATTYPGVRLQNSREQYHFADYPWQDEPDQHPTAAQILGYLQQAAKQFALDIRLRHEVVALVERIGGWTVRTRTGGTESDQEFDFVIVSIGQYAEGKHRPEFDNEAAFCGRIITERDVATLDEFDDRRVVVVGFGKSAVDMASFTAARARHVDHVFRTARWLVPFRILGLHYTYPLFSRGSTAFMPCWMHPGRIERFVHERLPFAVLAFWKLIERTVRRHIASHGRALDEDAAARLSVVTPAHGFIPDLRSATAMAPTDYYAGVASGVIEPHRAELAGFTEHGVMLSDGTTLDADVVVLSVGSNTPAFPFMPETYRPLLESEHDGVQLYRHLLHPDIPNLAFAGYNHGFMHVPAAEMGALWLCAWLDGDLATPPRDEMLDSMTRVRTWKRENIHFEPSRACAVNTRFQQYLDLLLRDLGLSPYRKLPNVIAEGFARYGAADYTGVVDAWLRRRGTVDLPRTPLPLDS